MQALLSPHHQLFKLVKLLLSVVLLVDRSLRP